MDARKKSYLARTRSYLAPTRYDRYLLRTVHDLGGNSGTYGPIYFNQRQKCCRYFAVPRTGDFSSLELCSNLELRIS